MIFLAAGLTCLIFNLYLLMVILILVILLTNTRLTTFNLLITLMCLLTEIFGMVLILITCNFKAVNLLWTVIFHLWTTVLNLTINLVFFNLIAVLNLKCQCLNLFLAI